MSDIKYDALTDDLVVFKEFNSVNEAEVIKSVLDSAGIDSTIANEYMSTFYPLGIIYPQIIIRRCDLERAQELIK
ncbi:MAG: DUF2007 domain-containing protein [Rikenellaceae bacterium]